MTFDVLASDGSKEIRRYTDAEGNAKIGVINFVGIGTHEQIENKEKELLTWIQRLGAFNILPGVRVRRVAKAMLVPFLHKFQIEVDLTDAIVGF